MGCHARVRRRRQRYVLRRRYVAREAKHVEHIRLVLHLFAVVSAARLPIPWLARSTDFEFIGPRGFLSVHLALNRSRARLVRLLIQLFALVLIGDLG